MRFDTSIFGLIIFLLEVNMKANVRLDPANDLKNAVGCYQGDWTAFELEEARVDLYDYWYDGFYDDSDE